MIRYEVFFPSVQLKDIHPDKIYQRELSLAKSFVSKLDTSISIDPCPISKLQRHEVLFEKWGQRYALCPKTWSLSLGSMPNEESLRRYFFDSDLARYRSTDKYQKTYAKLRQQLWNNQIELVEGRVRRYLGMDKYRLIDWGSRSFTWVSLLKNAAFVAESIITEPMMPVTPEGLPEDGDVILLFDVIQRTTTPQKIVDTAFKALRPGGLLILTTRSGSGFDILTLLGDSESIFPLDHVCLPSPQGMSLLLEEAGFDILELTTPGLLDVQLVRHEAEQIPVHQYFQRYLISQFDEHVHERLQGFLQQNNLSSHLRVVAIKPEL